MSTISIPLNGSRLIEVFPYKDDQNTPNMDDPTTWTISDLSVLSLKAVNPASPLDRQNYIIPAGVGSCTVIGTTAGVPSEPFEIVITAISPDVVSVGSSFGPVIPIPT